MSTIPKLMLKPKTPTAGAPHTPPAGPPSSAAPRMPSQGHSAQDDDDNVPPPPERPNGKYLVSKVRVHPWIDKDTGLTKRDANGRKVPASVFVTVDDPKETEKARMGKPNCLGIEVSFKLDLEGDRYVWTERHLTALGLPPSTWPGKMSALRELIETSTKGKKFLATIKTNEGTGQFKGRLFTNLDKLEPAPVTAAKPVARPAPHTPPAAAPTSTQPDTSAADDEAAADPDTTADAPTDSGDEASE